MTVGIRYAVIALTTLIFMASCHVAEPPTLSPDLKIPSSNGQAAAAVVFIHGVLGDPVTSFGSAKSNWPLLIAKDPDFGPRVDVMSIGYESKPIAAASNINEIANRLLNRLIDEGIFDHHEKVIFVVHSMGGLIAKRMLVQLKTDKPALFQRVAGIIFLATPAGGSSVAETANWVSGNPQFQDMKPEDVNTFLQVLEDDWQALLRARTQQFPFPQAYCVYETKPLGPITVVPRSRAQSGCDERPIAFDRNHSSLVKPTSANDEVYVYVAARLKRLLQDEPQALQMSAAVLGADGKSLSDDPILHSGDSFALALSANRAAWFYVVGQDSTGRAQRYFPSSVGGHQDAPTRSQRIPADTSMMLYLDQNKGVERIHVFATQNRSPEIEKLIERVESLSTKAASRVLDDEVSKRGAYVAPIRRLGMTPALDTSGIKAEDAHTLLIDHR